MKPIRAIIQQVSLFLLMALCMPLGHDVLDYLGLHGHHRHAQEQEHECSSEQLSDAHHLHVYHGLASACEEHEHLLAEEERCELCALRQEGEEDFCFDSSYCSIVRQVSAVEYWSISAEPCRHPKSQHGPRAPPSSLLFL